MFLSSKCGKMLVKTEFFSLVTATSRKKERKKHRFTLTKTVHSARSQEYTDCFSTKK